MAHRRQPASVPRRNDLTGPANPRRHRRSNSDGSPPDSDASRTSGAVEVGLMGVYVWVVSVNGGAVWSAECSKPQVTAQWGGCM
jgi:hypothetical protein